MVATAGVDLVMAIVWVGGITVLLIGRALVSWQRFRHNSNFALQARRLSEAMGSGTTQVQPRQATANVIPMHGRPKAAAGF